MSRKKLIVDSLDYSIIVIGDSLKVGCQTITQDDALEIAEFINQADFEEQPYFSRAEAKKVMKATGCSMQGVNWGHKSPNHKLFYNPDHLKANEEGFVYSTGYSILPAHGTLTNYDMFEVVK